MSIAMRSRLVLLAALACSCDRGMDPKVRFRDDYVAAVRAADSSVQIERVNDLEVRITKPGGKPFTAFLDNAYADVERDPSRRSAVIERYAKAILEGLGQKSALFDRSRVVPVIKDRAWLSDMAAAQKAQGSEKPLELVVDDYNEDLVVVYGLDSPTAIQYVNRSSFEVSGVPRAELRSIAIENLRRLVPNIEVHKGAVVSMITAGGDYEASLLLLDEVWRGDKVSVEGDMLVTIPARDVLLFAGSNTPGAVEQLRTMGDKFAKQGGHTLTPTLFVRQDGRFVPWKKE